MSEDLWLSFTPEEQLLEIAAQPHGFHPVGVTPCVPAPAGSANRAPREGGTRAEGKAERARSAVNGTARYAFAVLMLLLAQM